VKRFFRTPWIARKVFSGRTWGFSSSDAVYLTFDDGPTKALTPWILEVLAREEIKASFFCVGENARKHPELMEQMRAAGHQIGNHTMRHEKGTQTSFEAYKKSIDEAAAYTSTQLFRPPYGRMPAHFTRKLRTQYRIIMWSWLSYDYDPNVSVEQILQSAESIKAGDILVFHDNVKVEERLHVLLPALIHILKAKGLRFALISA
jgi:peptidoglycan/xylan/chitin deacetylase (PgdA/CDA1 family)